MKKLIVLTLILCSSTALAWEYTTPLGIRIRAKAATLNQFNRHWTLFEAGTLVFPFRPPSNQLLTQNLGPTWDKIDWNRIDDFFRLLYEKHGRPASAEPRGLVITIAPVSYRCQDEEVSSYEFLWRGICIDGVYAGSNRITIHLGDDPGQDWLDFRAFCATALGHEMNHYFLFWKGDSCWNREGSCLGKHQSVEELCGR